MLDFNSSATFSERVTAFIDEAIKADRAAQPQRRYLGASRIGHACERALQYEYAEAPVDPGRELPGRVIRVFEVGHALEDLAIRWLRLAGFELYTRKTNGEPFGLSVGGGRIQGHVDGVLNGGPDALGLAYPALFECKTMNHKTWRETVKHRLAKAKPVYAAQVALYQAYMEASIPGISQNPALFAAINKDSQELYFESVPFDGGLAQRMSDRAVRILQATEASELRPRIATTPTHQECKACPWQDAAGEAEMTEAIEPAGEHMIDARQASSALHLPYYWFSDPKARAKKRIPYYLLGGLVRFRISELDAW